MAGRGAAERQQETSLYAAVKQHLEGLGYEAKGEVCGCGIVAVRPGEPAFLVITELKLGFTLELVLQAVDRMAAGSLPRIASTEHIAKRLREGEEGGTDSPRGFVPFRSLRSYENLLALQAQAAAGAG